MYPFLNSVSRARSMIDNFGGYNHNLRIGENEFFDIENMTSDHAPVLAPRKKRGIFKEDAQAVSGLIEKTNLCYVDGSAFVINGEAVDLGLTEGEKTVVSMGAYAVIFPDGKYINTEDRSDKGSIAAKQKSNGNVRFCPCLADGTEIVPTYGETAPENTTGYWVDTSVKPNALMQYSESAGTWVSVSPYIKVSAPGIANPFSVGDGVFLGGLDGGDLIDADAEDGALLEDQQMLADLSGTCVILAIPDITRDGAGEIVTQDSLVINGVLKRPVSITNEISVERKTPDMDFVTESNNRLWGCKYGTVDGKTVNEIYACKLGDFKNWYCYQGISTDSYAVSVGTDGAFTGAVTHLGYPVFFKENWLHKVYGSYPANYQMQTTQCRGVQKGSHKSLAIVDEKLLYKSRNGICVYDGSLPVEISYVLGEVSYHGAVAASHNRKYYVSMASGNDRSLFVYDLGKGLWHREDNINLTQMCSCNEFLYGLADGKIVTLVGAEIATEDKVKWMAQTGEIGLSLPDKKYLCRMVIRMSMEIGAKATVWVQYDMETSWHPIYTITGTSLRSFSLPIHPRRSDYMRIKITGEGDCRIYSITKSIAQGSDVS